MTAAGDGTIRLWDVAKPDKNRQVLKFKSTVPRLEITACAFAPSGKLLGGGAARAAIGNSSVPAEDRVRAAAVSGSIEVWDATATHKSTRMVARARKWLASVRFVRLRG